MLKIEYVWRELLYQAIEQKNPYFSLTKLGKNFNLSTSVVSHALFPLRELGVVEVKKTKSTIRDAEKLLFFWATRRNLKKDIVYQTRSPLPVFEREASMPTHVLPTAYSAYRLYGNTLPSDYENVYVYSNNIDEIKKRFPLSEKIPNLFILKADPYLLRYKQIPVAQLFADLWNVTEWYAKEFSDALLLSIRQNLGI